MVYLRERGMKLVVLLGLFVVNSAFARPDMVSEVVYVESPTDTDSDGKPDRIYVTIDRPVSDKKLSTIFRISPYALGGTDVPMHDVDSDLLPQDELLTPRRLRNKEAAARNYTVAHRTDNTVDAPRYANIKAHSVGTGYSTGCPTVGDINETLAAKAVIDWLNGRAKAFYENGFEAKADWANGHVGMTGTSYDGTLPIMVATTGVEGLKAIIPVAAISNWYDYYRANGLVVNPGGYIGEDADILGYYIVRRNACKAEMANLTKLQGRENGDFTPFWQARDYVPAAKNIKAAVFIIHGQSDWNVKQRHAIQLWEALEGGAPRRMFLHRGGHSSTGAHGVPKKVQDWFDHFLEGVDNGITAGPQVEVELSDGSLMTQNEWPSEETQAQRLYFNSDALQTAPAERTKQSIVDSGKTQSLESLVENPTRRLDGRLVFLTAPLAKPMVISGTSKITLSLAVLNRRAANVTVAVVEYDQLGRSKIITRGWADPQNFNDVTQGDLLVPGKSYSMTFDLEPKQARLAAGSRLGLVLASTDKDYTLRPSVGTQIQFNLGSESFAELHLSK